jgi:pimeloyl-ACP methyl ester carboxylesterase
MISATVSGESQQLREPEPPRLVKPVANHLKAPAVIGHYLGGLIAMKLAIDHPADVARLMIVDSLPFAGLAGPQATAA